VEFTHRFNQLVRHFQADMLFQNSVYLMLSTLVQAGFGFVFWLLNARLFAPEQIGLASALISASTFIAYFSLLGFNSTFIRFLPTSKERNANINTGLVLVLGTSALMAGAYVLLVPGLAPKLNFVNHNLLLAVAFVVLSAFAATNLLTDSVFIAYRSSRYNLLVYTVQSFVKLVLPVALVAAGAFGIFAATGIAAGVALALSLYFMAKRFDYQPEAEVNSGVVKKVWQFSSGSYVANMLNILPTLVLPLIIVDKLGPAQAGYFYLAFMLANLLYAVSYSVSQALFAEGSYGEVAFKRLLARGAGLLAAIMVPVGVVMAVAGPYVLSIFGKSYSADASQVLVVLALAAPAVAAYVLGCVLLRITKQIVALVMVNLVYAVSVCGLALAWSGRGLTWVAGAWLAGNMITAFLSFALVRYRGAESREPAVAAATGKS
jgi:O-antigen/teichoic acid export membrane protein